MQSDLCSPDLYADAGRPLIDVVREALRMADMLGLSTTSLHLNAALVTLDGEGVPPMAKQVCARC
ncbi:hypothetical protein [uncultured Sphingomonas sp.]|uniref:hypothetical protein n=1 Tax=uncultured Sphingomonas sp. TaxID=158754 RepID=UPI0025E9CFCF|nr:hypothetical protein [uncultured Sphingomonas sp.]